jgi:DNA repair protein RadD
MSIDINQVVLKLKQNDLQTLLGEGVLTLINHLDPNLVRSDSIKKLVVGVDGGIELLAKPEGWRAIVGCLSQKDASDLCAVMNLSGGNVYEVLQANSFDQIGDDVKSSVLNFFKIETRVEAPAPIATSRVKVMPKYPLFEHQRIPAAHVMSKLTNNSRKCVLHLPTGGGKTRTSMVVVCRWLVENPGKSVVWLASSGELLEQAAQEFECAWKFLGDRDVAVHRVWGSRNFDIQNYSDTFVVGGLGKLVAASKKDDGAFEPLLEKVSLIVFDEAHQILAPTYKELVDLLRSGSNDVSLLGLTATPGRTPENDVEDEALASYFNLNKVTISIPGYTDAIEYLVSEGFLARANYIDIKFEANDPAPDESPVPQEFGNDLLDLLGEDQLRNAELVKAVIALIERHSRILLFAPSVASARQISFVLRAIGIDAYSLDGGTSEVAREKMINKFKGNLPSPQVLCNYGVLTTGFDAPRTSCVIIGRPTKSVVLYSQMVGRALRGVKVGGNSSADIVTVVDTSLEGFGSVSEGFDFWNNKWWD